MNSSATRPIIAHAAIGVSLCIGAYSFFVDPLHRGLAGARAEEARCEAELRPAEGLRDGAAAMSAGLESAEREAVRMRELGRIARDERDLFASITSLAESCHVQIDQLAPMKIGTPAAPRDPDAAPLSHPLDAVAGYSITVLCSYQDLARFLREIRSELGYSLIRSVRIAPLADERARLVQAVIDTEHYAFEPAPPPAEAGAPEHPR